MGANHLMQCIVEDSLKTAAVAGTAGRQEGVRPGWRPALAAARKSRASYPSGKGSIVGDDDILCGGFSGNRIGNSPGTSHHLGNPRLERGTDICGAHQHHIKPITLGKPINFRLDGAVRRVDQ